MLVQLKKNVTVEETVEIGLPAYYKSEPDYYMIAEDETIINLFSGVYYQSITVHKKESLDYSTRLANVIKSEPISGTEFHFQFVLLMESLENAIKKPV